VEVMADAITKITVGGFKSIKSEQSIEVRPLTILAGANSSGKSSIMQPLLLMKQTLEQTFDPGVLWLGGPNVSFSSSDELFSRGLQTAETFCVRVDAGPQRWHRVCFRQAHISLEVAEVEFQLEKFRSGRIRLDMPEKELNSNLSGLAGTEWRWEVRPWMCGVGLDGRGPNDTRSLPSISAIGPAIHRVSHLPGLRGNLKRTYSNAAFGPRLTGTFDYYTGSFILAWQQRGNEESRRRLEAAMKKLGLTSRIEAKQLDATQISVHVARVPTNNGNGADDLVDIADVGFGVSHTLPVIVGLIAATDNNLVFIEEPEAHLHPNAQLEMASILADAAKRGVRVVAETHSSILLRGVQTLVAKGRLAPDLVKLYWFTRDKQGFTKIHGAELDENGAFGEKWPEDFDDIELGAESDYLDAVEARHARR
jgi:predicted ATPase